ncbi:MAG: hypothetical protein Q7T38_08240 [Gallionella sp.]|nr:hypothetical protein [Gallionella sp.]
MKKILILLITCLFLTTAACASELEIINLKHRNAEELIPIIRPLLDKDEMVSGMNYQLILRASPRNISQIKRLLEGIDTLPRRLKITVMQNVDSDTVARLTEISGSVGVGNARISAPGSTGRDGLNARIISTRSLEDDKKTQQLQVLEGNRALVKSGQSVPVPQRQVVQNAWGTQVIETTQYRDVSSGFYVLPRIHGDTVTLEISAQNDSLAPNQSNYPVTRIQNTSSIVSGRLGEWINVGGGGQQSSTDNSTITTRSTSRLNEERNVLIKVEEVN